MGSQDKCSELTVGDILIHSTASPVSDVRLESEGCRSTSMDVWRNTGFFVLRPVCSLIGVSVIGFFLAQATFDAVILGIYPFGAALGRVRVQDGIISGFKIDHTGEV